MRGSPSLDLPGPKRLPSGRACQAPRALGSRRLGPGAGTHFHRFSHPGFMLSFVIVLSFKCLHGLRSIRWPLTLADVLSSCYSQESAGFKVSDHDSDALTSFKPFTCLRLNPNPHSCRPSQKTQRLPTQSQYVTAPLASPMALPNDPPSPFSNLCRRIRGYPPSTPPCQP